MGRNQSNFCTTEHGGFRNGAAHFSGGMIRQIADRIQRFLRRTGRDQHLFTCQIMGERNFTQNILHQILRFRKLSRTYRTAGQPTGCGGDDLPAILAQDLLNLILNYYEGGISIPKEVLLGFEAEDEDVALLSEYLSLIGERRVSVRCAERGDGKALCDMAYANAKEHARVLKEEGERENKALKRLSELLGLDSVPERIEAYDISNVGDESIVASMVVSEKGKMKKNDYRFFKINSPFRDDYGSMREALTRRLSHIGDGSASLGERPDLILLDGGDGHVNTVKGVLSMLECDIPVYGMVKDDYHKTRAITDGEKEISIALEMNVYTFIYNIQEEAHRFAYLNSQSNKLKTLTSSSLEKIKGIGKAKAKRLLSAMRLSDIKIATAEELMKIDGISKSDAENIESYFKKIGNDQQ